MPRATLRFYAELNDFLPPADRHKPVQRPFTVRQSIKDLIEATGVPHTEVDLVLVNGESVGFARPMSDGDRVSVYPVFESVDISAVTKVRPEPLRDPPATACRATPRGRPSPRQPHPVPRGPEPRSSSVQLHPQPSGVSPRHAADAG